MPDESQATHPTAVTAVTKNMLRRSIVARLSAWLSIVIMSGLAIFVLFIFSDAGYYGGSLRYLRPEFDITVSSEDRARIRSQVEDLRTQLADANAKKSKDQLDAEVKLAELEVQKLKMRGEDDKSLRILGAITSSITRVGAVLVVLYLIQILLSVMRYCFKVADHLAAAANAIVLSGGRPRPMREYLDTTATSHFDFGKVPNTPGTDVKELVDKLSSKLADTIRSQKDG